MQTGQGRALVRLCRRVKHITHVEYVCVKVYLSSLTR